MAIKTFTTGEVLTAADTNTYLANSGLVYVTSGTIGSGVTSITVSNAFSATYDNYRIVVSGGTSSGGAAGFGPFAVQLGSTVSGYKYSLVYATFATNAVAAACSASASSVLYLGQNAANANLASFDINGPYLAGRTSFAGSYFDATNAGHVSAYLDNSTSYTAFTIGTVGPTMTGGTVTVYGYRKA